MERCVSSSRGEGRDGCAEARSSWQRQRHAPTPRDNDRRFQRHLVMRSRIGFAVRDDGCGRGKSRQPLPLPAAGSRTAARFSQSNGCCKNHVQGRQDQGPRAARLCRSRLPPISPPPSACSRRSARPMSSTASRRVETPFVEYTDALGQVPARPGPPERGRVLVPGRRRAVAVAALRPDRAARPLRGRELRRPAEALSQLPRRLGVPQREAGTGPLPPVHAVRRRHGRARPPSPRMRRSA